MLPFSAFPLLVLPIHQPPFTGPRLQKEMDKHDDGMKLFGSTKQATTFKIVPTNYRVVLITKGSVRLHMLLTV